MTGGGWFSAGVVVSWCVFKIDEMMNDNTFSFFNVMACGVQPDFIS